MLKNSLNFGGHSSISFTIILISEELLLSKNFPQPVRKQKNSNNKNTPFIFFTKYPTFYFILFINKSLTIFQNIKISKNIHTHLYNLMLQLISAFPYLQKLNGI